MPKEQKYKNINDHSQGQKIKDEVTDLMSNEVREEIILKVSEVTVLQFNQIVP